MSSLFTVYSHYLTVIRLPLPTSSPNGFMVLTPHYIPPSTEKSCEFPSISRTAAASRCGADNIELDLNRGVNPFGPIRRQDTEIGGCHLVFFPITFVQGRGLNSESR